MIETIARAMCADDCGNDTELVELGWRDYVSNARTAFSAMAEAEVTDGMVVAWERAAWLQVRDAHLTTRERAQVEWRAMCEAAKER